MPVADELLTTEIHGTIEVRDIAKRELGLFIVPWNTVVETRQGPEMFVPGAFANVDPTKVRLRMDHADPPTGKGIALEERADGAYMAFRVSKTARGDDQLTLAADGTSDGASVGFLEVPGGTRYAAVGGRRVRVHERVDLREVSTTWRPAYDHAAVTYIRSKENPVSENETPIAEPAAIAMPADPGILEGAIDKLSKSMATGLEKLGGRLEAIEERNRADFQIPAHEPIETDRDRGHWMQYAVRVLSGERVPALQTRAWEDLISSENVGVVPDAFSKEVIGTIDSRRPFLGSTRRLPTPDAGLSLIVPRIVTRPTVGVQSTEKSLITSTNTAIDTVNFDAVTLAGGGDISLQLLKRSSPSFLQLYLDLLAEAYSMNAEAQALAALFDNFGDPDFVNDGGTFDPESSTLGDAWTAGLGSSLKRAPDTIWLSTAAVGAFIDAKATGTNLPLYSGLRADFTAAGGVGGTVSGLRPVYVPALDSTDVDVLCGPSAGFAWAEDGTFTLQVDVPSKAGRDVAIVGIVWNAPLYPAAFTGWALIGS